MRPGVVKATANFGVFSGDILVGNAGDGIINVFDPASGAFVEQLKDGNGNPIINLDLHGMVFGDGVTGDQNAPYIAAGLSGDGTGVLGAIKDNAGDAAPDFALTASPSDATVNQGENATFAVTATPVGESRGLFTFSCVSPAGASCIVGSVAVDAATGAARANVAVSTSSTAPSTQIAGLGIPGAVFLWFSLRSRKWRKAITALPLRFAVLLVLASGLIGIVACGGRKPVAPSAQSLPVVVTATTGALCIARH